MIGLCQSVISFCKCVVAPSRRWALLAAVACLGIAYGSSAVSVAHEPSATAARGAPEAQDDLIVASRSGESGYQLFTARAHERWAWRPLATVQPAGNDAEPWIGYHCVTGSGRFVVAVVAPRRFVNRPHLRDRGALAYVVSVDSGEVRPLVAGVSLKYHTPGCGLGDRVVLTRSLGRDQAQTEALVADAERAIIRRRVRVAGQITSVVPTEAGLVGLSGTRVVRLRDGGARVVAELAGRPFVVRAARQGVDVLAVEAPRRVSAWRVTSERVRRIGHGAAGRMALFAGRKGRNVLVGATRLADPAGLHLARPPSARPRAASNGGSVVLSAERAPAGRTARTSSTHPAPAAGGVVRPADVLTSGRTGRTVGVGLPESVAPAFTREPRSLAVRSGRAPAARIAANTTTPKCAVPRNHLRRQVPQPTAAQVNWAIQQATRNLLKGAVLTRPAGYANMQLASYQPSLDFARGPLAGNPDSAVPPSVIQAVFAQESAWLHASRRALPGLSGNPSISDYYGSGGTLDVIDYDRADCGYGVSQVTDYMTASNPYLSANGKAKVAVDYAENVAVGITFLVNKWNQLYNAGVRVNDGDADRLENWYFAVWAYNSGFHPDSGSGPWGLGWTNNPMNSDYPADRDGFLRESYADAEHPGDWPYQERVVGWMETPQLDYKGNPQYVRPRNDQGAQVGVRLPAYSAFCTPSNECSPSHVTGDGKDYCMRTDRKCWWHEPVHYADCATACANSVFTVGGTDPEPAADNNYPPRCQTGLSADTIVVDNQPSKLNVEGCANSTWTNHGSFTVDYGKTAAGVELGQIDWHQLGTGFGGHTWFTKNQRPQDTAHINTGTWTPPPLNGIYNVKVHVPVNGASTSFARYRVHRGDGTFAERVIDQHLHENRWVSLGNFTLQSGAKIVLDNVTPEGDERQNVAFDAVSFTPVQGTRVRKTIDAVTSFDSNQNLDSMMVDIPFWDPTVFKDMDGLYGWGEERTRPLVGLEDCHGLVKLATCLGPQTKDALIRWRNRVLTAGNVPRTPEAPDTQAKWLGFANPDPPATLTDEFVANSENYKVRSRLTIEYLQADGLIDPSSVSVAYDARTGNTEIPGFIMDLFRALSAEYNIPVPNLRYTARDLSLYTHASTEVDARETGILPGRAFHPWVTEPTMEGNCVTARAISGGTIGFRPMLHQPPVVASVDFWREQVRGWVVDGQAPQGLADLADDIYDLFFSPGDLGAADPESPFWFAPAIWTQHNARVCGDGTVTPISGANLVDSGYMPDLYIYVNAQQVDLQGLPTDGPAQTGDFYHFSAPGEGIPKPTAKDPWDPCYHVHPSDPSFVDRRDGTPWELEFSTSDDETPDAVRLCNEPKDVRHRE